MSFSQVYVSFGGHVGQAEVQRPGFPLLYRLFTFLAEYLVPFALAKEEFGFLCEVLHGIVRHCVKFRPHRYVTPSVGTGGSSLSCRGCFDVHPMRP